MRRLGIILAVGAALLAAAPVAGATLRPRPTDAPTSLAGDGAPNALQVFDDYGTPARSFVSGRAVVHYVVLGPDAPPLNDDDRSGVPDYVERAGAAADRAIAYYERRGFTRITGDTGGPDGRPDLYVSLFSPGYLGVAFPAARAAGGAFVAISNRLDPSAGRSFCSLDGTVAHELFHLVQFSYYPPADDPPIPGWVLEGTAAAMETRVDPELDDTVTALQLRRWFEHSDRSLTEQTYGAQLLWRYLDERAPSLLPALLTRLAAPRAPLSAAAALATTYLRVAGRPFAPAFARFAGWVEAEQGDRIRPHATLAPGESVTARVAPLSVHFVRVGRSARSIAVRVVRGSAEIALQYRLDSEVAGEPATTLRLRARTAGGAVRFAIPAALRRSARVARLTLVLANGNATGTAAYAVSVR
jgi:hypothetical protein